MIGSFILGCILAFAAMFVLPFRRDAEGLKLGFGLLAAGSALIVLPMVSILGDVREIIGVLLFCFSYLLLIPAIGTYKKYRSFVSDAFLSRAEKAEKERAWNRMCVYVCLFILGALFGFLLTVSSLAV